MSTRGEPEGARLFGAGLALLLSACRPPAPNAPPDAGLPPKVAASSQVALSFPSGWVENAGADGVVRASSPRGLQVLRAEVQRGVGLPTAATLRTGFLGGLRHLRERSDSVSEAPGFIAMRFVLGEPDAGGQDTEALLSATALGEDTLLCATLRGATREELDAVQAACQAAGSAFLK